MCQLPAEQLILWEATISYLSQQLADFHSLEVTDRYPWACSQAMNCLLRHRDTMRYGSCPLTAIFRIEDRIYHATSGGGIGTV